MSDSSSFLLFSGSSHPAFAEEMAHSLGKELGKLSLSTYPDNEIGVVIDDNVRGRDVFVLQTIARRPNHYLMELLIIIDALKRASARRVSAVIPYFGYARQDRKEDGKRVPITAKLVADLLQTAGVDHVLSMDLHAEQIQGFFDRPVDALYARNTLLEAVNRLGLDSFVVVSPDLGSIKLARSFAQKAGAEFAIVDKRRLNAERVQIDALIGSVDGKDVLLVDDMISTGGTLQTAARICREAGARRVFAVATHGVFSEGAIDGSAIEKMLVTNTIPQADEFFSGAGIDVVSVAPLFGQAIATMQSAGSISSLH